ncbi:MAG: hypothetical protein UV50_C0005G0024 [Parcubacteria group bacterium GW2011_GWB1_42_9]|nr:MAG: hypothetical protein UV50_C0005G0024 [Parcubacteria group bacterium GW2011_GWB1_42_9]
MNPRQVEIFGTCSLLNKKPFMQNKITIIAVIVIILSLGIISAIVYKQRATIIDSSLKAGQAIIEFFPLGESKKPTWSSTSTKDGLSPSSDNTNTGFDNSNMFNKPAWEKITNLPIVGASVLNLSQASNTAIYLEKETGNIFMLKNGVGEPIRISNVTILEVFDVYFGLNKNKNIGAIVRFPKDNQLESILLTIDLGKQSNSTTSDSLPIITKQALKTSIIAYTVSPKKDQVLYLEDLGNRVAVYVTDFSFKNSQIIKVLPFKDWVISWPEENTAVFQTKTNSQSVGSLYYLSLKNKSFRRVGNGILGFTVNANPDVKKIVYSVSTGNSFDFIYRELASGKSNTFTPKTLPEKCLWFDSQALVCAVAERLPKATYPDDWYKGKLSFKDNLWIYYGESGKSSRLYDLVGENSNLDLLPQARDGLNNFYFTDKTTGILYRLNGGRIFEP